MNQPRKITDLDKITDISTDDLLLISDWEGGKCLSKKMTMQQLIDYVISKVKASQAIKNQISSIATSVFNNNIDDGVIQGISANTDLVVDLLDGVVDQQVLIDCKDAGELAPEENEQQGE